MIFSKIKTTVFINFFLLIFHLKTFLFSTVVLTLKVKVMYVLYISWTYNHYFSPILIIPEIKGLYPLVYFKKPILGFACISDVHIYAKSWSGNKFRRYEHVFKNFSTECSSQILKRFLLETLFSVQKRLNRMIWNFHTIVLDIPMSAFLR